MNITKKVTKAFVAVFVMISMFPMMNLVINAEDNAQTRGATGGSDVEQVKDKDGNVSIFLNGNNAEIVENPEYPTTGAIIKTVNGEIKLKDGNITSVYAGGNDEKNDIVFMEPISIKMYGGNLKYILGGNYMRGSVYAVNIEMNGGNVGIIHGSSRDSIAQNTAQSLEDCKRNAVGNANIVMNGGNVQALIPGSFNLTYVNNATVTLRGGTVAATTSPAQSGILGGTNGKIGNLTINVEGGSTKDIALAQRTMIEEKAVINVTGGSVGSIYAGSYYDDGDSAAGTNKWGAWGIGGVNYGQANAIDINISEGAIYNDIYAGFQFLDKQAFLNKYKAYNYAGTANIEGSENIKATLNLAVKPKSIKGPKEQHTVSMIDSKYANTTWKVTGLTLDKYTSKIEAGKTTTLIASVSPTNATNKTVAWTTDNNKVATVDATGKVTGVGAGTATITATADGKTASCTVSVYEIKAPVIPPVDKDTNVSLGEEAKEVLKDVVKDIIENVKTSTAISNDTRNKLEAALVAGKEISVAPKVEVKKESAIEKEVVTKIENAMKATTEKDKVAEIAQYYDLSMMLTAAGEPLGTVNELTGKVEFTVSIPKDLTKAGRKFYMVRVHGNGDTERIEGKLDGTDFSFETDKFSIFALVYEDNKVETPTTPEKPGVDTGDVTNAGMLMTMLLAAGFVGFTTLKRRNRI